MPFPGWTPRAGPRVGILLAACLLCAGLGELGLRLALGDRLAPLYEEDEASLYRLIAGSRKLVKRPGGGEPILVRVNAEGFRGPELRPPGEARRVLVYGDSCILALFSDLEETYPARLAAELHARLPGRPFEVINAGVAGYGPDQILARMERELPRHRPELAIVALFADNDMGDLIRNRIFRLDGRGRLVRAAPELDAELAARFRGARGWLLPRALGRALGAGYRPAARGAEGPTAASLSLRREEHREYLRGEPVRNLLHDGYDADVSCDPLGDSARAKVALLVAVLGRMAETCRAASVPLVVVVIPASADACREAPGYDGPRADAARFPDYDPRALTQAMAGAAAAHGIPCLDLFDPFAAAADPAGLYFRGDDHWNGAGQALAARLTADFLVARGVVR